MRLAHSGAVLLGGDLYHLQPNVKHRRVPVHDVSRVETLASMSRVDGLIKTLHARSIVQRDADVSRELPRVRACLD